MDKLEIGSKIVKGVISKLIKMAVKKKFGYEVDVRIEELNAVIIDGKAHIHLNADAQMSKDELMKAIKTAGLD